MRPLSWIEEARTDYEARPWVSVALGLGVPVSESLVTIKDAAQAIADKHGRKSLELVVDRVKGTKHGPALVGFVAAELRQRRLLTVEDIDAVLVKVAV